MYNGQIVSKRSSEKSDEYLFLAYQRMAKGCLESGMGLLIAAAEQYGAKYGAVRVTLEDARRHNLLPDNFVMPSDVQQLIEMKEMYQKNVE